MKTIKSLVFKGGGVLGTAYVGAFQALQEVRLAGNNVGEDGKTPSTKAGEDFGHPSPGEPGVIVYGDVEHVSGTSAGSIFASLVAFGHSAPSIRDTMKGINFMEFLDIPGDGGVFAGHKFLEWMTKKLFRLYDDAGYPEKAPSVKPMVGPTFANLHALAQWSPRYKELHVFSRSIDHNQTVEFSYRTTPDVPVAQAVRASMSIPIVFQPWRFHGQLARRYPGGFVDGGVAYNYPISDLDSGDNLEAALGFFLADLSARSQATYDSVIPQLIHFAFAWLRDLYDKGQSPLPSFIRDLAPDTGAGYEPPYKGWDFAALVIEDVLDVLTDWGIFRLLGGSTSEALASPQVERRQALDSVRGELMGKMNGALDACGMGGAGAKRAIAGRIIELSTLAAVALAHAGKLRDEDSVIAVLEWIRSHLDELLDDLHLSILVPMVDSFFKTVEGLWVVLGHISHMAGPFGTLINPPANMVFQRDAARTVFVNNLGYGFADFGLPECNKDRLIASGYKCTKAYLDLILYS